MARVVEILYPGGEGPQGSFWVWGSTNERRCYIVTLSLIGCVYTQNDP